MKCKRLISCLVIVLIFCVIMTAIPTQTDAANTLYWPVPGQTKITQYFCPSYNPQHAAIDIGAYAGAPIIAAMGGTITELRYCTENHYGSAHTCNGFGTGMVIRGDDGLFYQYAHMLAGSIPSHYGIGTYVPQGGQVGMVGNTGNSNGNHLHFQICTVNWYTGAVDPLSFSYTHTNPVVTYENLGDDFYARIRYLATGHPISNVNNNVQLGGTGTLEEIWRFVRDSNGSYKIISAFNGQFMDVQGNSTDNFANIGCSPDNGGQANQRFYIQRSNSGYIIVAANSLKVLDVYNGANSVWGENVQLYSSLGTVDQVFNIEIIGCNVSYDANGGSGAPGVQLKWYDQPLTLSSTIPTRDGWTFMGWAESADATEAVYPAGGSYDVNTTANTTLYAVWQPASYNGFKYSISNGEVTITGYTGDATDLCIPDTINGYPVTAIGDSAFKEFYNLTSVTIPDSVTSIGNSAFYNCFDLTDVNIPDGITSIGEYTFCYCTSFTSVTIPVSVTSIGKCAFYKCSSLTDVYYCGTSEQWNSITILGNNDSLLNATLNYHNYGTPLVILQPTLTTYGQQQKTCSLCGDVVTETIDKLVGEVAYWNISLQNDFKVNFYLQVSESIATTAKVRVMLGDEMETYKISALEKTEDGYYQITTVASAAQMNDLITIMVMNGSEIASPENYTIRQYCDTILADATHSKYHALVKEMLNYGAMAQKYFGYDAENLANDGITGIANENVPESTEEMTISDNSNSLNFYGASLVYRDKIAIRYYFTGDITGMSVIVNGKIYTPVAKDGMCYVEIADILPQDLDQQIILVVVDVNGSSIIVTYGPMNYIVRMNAKGDEKTQNLLKALYNYHLAAKAL